MYLRRGIVKEGENKGMKETLKRIKADIVASAFLCIVLGVVLLIWPAETIGIFCRVLAIGLVIMGVIDITSYFMDKNIHPFAGVLGLIVLLVGIWVFIRPESVVSLIPFVIGVILCVHGIQDMKLAAETKGNGYEKWWSLLIIAVISLVFGVLCIVNAFGMVKLALQFIGIALIYDGASDLWVANRAVHSAKMMRQEAEAVDVEYREVDDDKE